MSKSNYEIFLEENKKAMEQIKKTNELQKNQLKKMKRWLKD